jgi:hypothetical protein
MPKPGALHEIVASWGGGCSLAVRGHSRNDSRNVFVNCVLGVLRFQRNMNSASKGCSGTGPFEALLFGQPTLPHVHVAAHLDDGFSKTHVLPLQPEAL